MQIPYHPGTLRTGTGTLDTLELPSQTSALKWDARCMVLVLVIEHYR